MNQAQFRKAVFDANIKIDESGHKYLICNGCGMPINPAREKWEADHIERKAIRGNNCPETNGQVLCKVCHKEKTAGDVAENAKGKRVSDKHFGIARKKGFR